MDAILLNTIKVCGVICVIFVTTLLIFGVVKVVSDGISDALKATSLSRAWYVWRAKELEKEYDKKLYEEKLKMLKEFYGEEMAKKKMKEENKNDENE